MAAVAHGDIHVVFGQSPPTITMYNAAGSSLGSAYVNPELLEASLSVGFTAAEYMNVAGEICARRAHGEFLTAEFQLRPKDSGASQAVADALKAATLGGAGFSFTVSGMKVIAAGSFADAFNCTPSTSPWFIEPGSAVRGAAQDPATVTVTAKRYAGLTSVSPATE